MSQRLALLIGHSGYQDDRLAVPHHSSDLAALAEVLRDRQHGRFDDVQVLLDKTAVDLQLAIAAFLEQPLAADDLIMLVFVGHCLLVDDDVFLAAFDAFTEPYLDATTIQADFIKRRLNQCPAQQALIVDCVQSRLDGAPDADAPRKLAHAFSGPNRVLLLATQTADAPPSAAFTQALTQGVHALAADADRDGRLTIAEWFAYAQARATEEVAPGWQKWGDPLTDDWALAAVSRDKLNPRPITPVLLSQPLPEPETAVPVPAVADSTGRRRRRWLAGLAMILLLILGGWYVLRGGFTPAAAPPVATPTTETAALAATETAVPLPNASGTATPRPASPTAAAATTAATATTTATATTAATAATPTVVTATATRSPSRTPAPSATVTVTASPSATATSTPIPMQITAAAAFLRAGPGINYRIVAYPPQGTAVTAVARNSDATWYNVVLEDGASGWIYTDVVRPDDTAVGPSLPLAATIPAPADEFYDFIAQDTGATLVIRISHAYVGTRGEDAFLRARLLPETDQVQPIYRNGNDLGLGLRIVEFSRTGSEPYTSTGVEFCMVDTAGEAFYCQTFSVRKEW